MVNQEIVKMRKKDEPNIHKGSRFFIMVLLLMGMSLSKVLKAEEILMKKTMKKRCKKDGRMNLWRSRKFKAILLSFIVMFLSLGCATYSRIGVDESGGIRDTFTESQDLRTIAEKMARSIIQVKAISMAKSPPRIAFLEMKNNSNELIDTDMFLEKIRTLLVKYAEGKVYFLDREKVKEIIKER